MKKIIKIIVPVFAIAFLLTVNAEAQKQKHVSGSASMDSAIVKKYIDQKIEKKQLQSPQKRLAEKIKEIEVICDELGMTTIKKEKAINVIKNLNQFLWKKEDPRYKDYIIHTNDKEVIKGDELDIEDLSLYETLHIVSKESLSYEFLASNFLDINTLKQAVKELPHLWTMWKKEENKVVSLESERNIYTTTFDYYLTFEIDEKKKEIKISLIYK